MTWIVASILAAFFQTIRTGLQRHLKQHLPTSAINWIRYSFGLPFIIVYVWALLASGYTIPDPGEYFLFYCLGAAIAQILGTGFLITLFSYRNFAVGTTYAKTESLQTAFLGVLLFGEAVSFGGLVAIIVGVIGILLISLVEEKITILSLIRAMISKTALIGLAAGAAFSFSGLFIRQATLDLDGSYIINAASTLLVVMVMQIVLLGIWMFIRNRNIVREILQHWKAASLVGLTSTLGSIGWFTAFALTNAAYVKTVGQVELLFALFLSHHFFKEHINKKEIAGMVLVVGSIILLISLV